MKGMFLGSRKAQRVGYELWQQGGEFWRERGMGLEGACERFKREKGRAEARGREYRRWRPLIWLKMRVAAKGYGPWG